MGDQVNVGDVLHLSPDDYRGGTEPLDLQVTAVLGLVGLSDGLWINVLGVDLDDRTVVSIFVSL